METVNAVVQLISTVGFPIVMCGVMGYYVKYLNDQHTEEMKQNNDLHREEINQINEQHRDEVDKLTTTIENNTVVMEKLSTKIDTIINLKGSEANE